MVGAQNQKKKINGTRKWNKGGKTKERRRESTKEERAGFVDFYVVRTLDLFSGIVESGVYRLV